MTANPPPCKTCQRCYHVMPSALHTCYACGHDTGPVRWTIISRNERFATVGEHHWFAARCRPGAPWIIDELDQAVIHGSRSVRRLPERFTTRQVTAWLKGLQ